MTLNNNWIRAAGEGIEIFLHCQPGAKKTEVQGIHGDRLKIRLAAPPVEGKANEALIAWLAKELGIPKLNIQLINGDTGRQKRLLISGVTLEKIQSLLPLED
jgi:uncharacterized protein (TIGR00251 family)